MNDLLNINEIRPDVVMVDQKKKMQQDIDRIGADVYEKEYVNCPACDKNNYSFLYEKYNTNHVLCNHCGTQYVNPRLSESSLKRFYIESDNYEYWAEKVYNASFEIRKNKIFIPRWNKLKNFIKGKNLNKVFMEVGSAHGIFCDIINEDNYFKKVIGIEPTPGLASLSRKLNVDTIEDSYENVRIDYTCSVIASFEVIEHLHNPYKFLKWIYSNLELGGCVFLSCPNIGGFETSVLGKESGTVDHQHINLFNTQSLQALVERAGFEKVKVETPGHLDYELVLSALNENKITINDIPVNYRSYFEKGNENSANILQNILIKKNKSSHMTLFAFKLK